MKYLLIASLVLFSIGCTQQAQSSSSEVVAEYVIPNGQTICWQPLTVADGDTKCQNDTAAPQLNTCKSEEQKAGQDTSQESLDTSKTFEKCMRNAGWFKAMQTIKF